MKSIFKEKGIKSKVFFCIVFKGVEEIVRLSFYLYKCYYSFFIIRFVLKYR